MSLEVFASICILEGVILHKCYKTERVSALLSQWENIQIRDEILNLGSPLQISWEISHYVSVLAWITKLYRIKTV